MPKQKVLRPATKAQHQDYAGSSKPNSPRLDRWKAPVYGIMLVTPPPPLDSKFAQALNEHSAKSKNQGSASMVDCLRSAKELIFDKINGKYVFHVVLFCVDPERFQLRVTNTFDMIDLTPDEIKLTLVRALALNVPVYPNTKDVEEPLVRFHKELIEDGFSFSDDSGSKKRFELVNPFTKVLGKLATTEAPSPAEVCLMREALQAELLQRDEAGRILANLRIAINELENVLTEQSRNENKLQIVLTRNPILFGLEYRRIIPKHQLGADFEMDYALERVSGTYDLVEIEASCHKLFTKDSNPTKELVHAEQQVLDWLTWIERHSEYARERLPMIQMPIGYVVIGRRSTLPELDNRRLARRNMAFRGTLQIMTYDELLDKAKNILNTLQGKKS